MDEDDSNNIIGISPRPRPVVLLLLDGWGVAPASDANIISLAKTPNFSRLSEEYPVAILNPGPKNLNARYLALGSGQDCSDENIAVASSLAQILSESSKRQLKLAATERFAALTYFFNGHREDKFGGEDWEIFSSVSSAPVKLALSLKRLVKKLVANIEADSGPDFIAAALPYLDLVATSGDIPAVIGMAELLDKQLRLIVSAIENKGGILLISAAAGNVEKFHNLATDLIDSSMTDNPVPLIIIGAEFKGQTVGWADPLNNDLSSLSPAGNLSDLAPTILGLMGLQSPTAMTGKNLLKNK